MDSYRCYSVFTKKKRSIIFATPSHSSNLALDLSRICQKWFACTEVISCLVKFSDFHNRPGPLPSFLPLESCVWSFFQLSKQCHILALCQKIMSKLRSSGTSMWNFNFARNKPIIYCLFSAEICFVFPLLDHFCTITRMMAIAAVLQMPSRRTISTGVSKSHLCS